MAIPIQSPGTLRRPRPRQALPLFGELFEHLPSLFLLRVLFRGGKSIEKRLRSDVSTVTRPVLSTFERPTILKRPDERPGHKVNLKVPSRPFHARSAVLSFHFSASISFSQHRIVWLFIVPRRNRPSPGRIWSTLYCMVASSSSTIALQLNVSSHSLLTDLA